MHEAGLIDEVLRTAALAAERAGCSRIRRIVLRVGRLSSAVPEALEFAFEALKPGTAAAGATLEIQRIEAAAFCSAANGNSPSTTRSFSARTVANSAHACAGDSSWIRCTSRLNDRNPRRTRHSEGPPSRSEDGPRVGNVGLGG
jgi:hydrogenase nickel incorporation protein HypA/HybF